jgi:hypothetical protein
MRDNSYKKKNMKKTIAIFALVFLFGNIFAQTKNFNYFLKGNIGTTMNIGIFNSKGVKIGNQVLSITETKYEIDTPIIYYKHVTSGVGPVITLNYPVKYCNSASYLQLKYFLNVAQFVDSKITTLEPEWQTFPDSLFEGQDLQGYTMIRDYGSYKITTKMINKKVISFEKIITPVGEYECVKITYTIEATTNYGVFVSNYIDWYNVDLGLIRQEAYTKEGRLENYFLMQSISVK